MLRIFVVSSHLSAVFQALYAKKTSKIGYIDVLLIDDYYKKETLVESIKETKLIHDWQHIIDFSVRIDDAISIKPNFRKRVLRKIKHLPLISFFYKRMVKGHVILATKNSALKIQQRFTENGIRIADCKVELFLLTQTALNAGLRAVFPNATINYMEHGTGDYFYISKLPSFFNNYYCVFNTTFKEFLKEKSNPREKNIESYLEKNEFELAMKTIAPQNFSFHFINTEKKHILILLDAFECYNPQSVFWTDYLDRCLKEIPNKEQFCYLVKPHPNQSNESIDLSVKHLEKLGVEFILLNNKGDASIAIESLYVKHIDLISHVFTTFSSAVFYLAKYYPQSSKFYILYDFVEKYTHRAPKQYKEIFYGLNEMITKVFDEGKIIRLK